MDDAALARGDPPTAVPNRIGKLCQAPTTKLLALQREASDLAHFTRLQTPLTASEDLSLMVVSNSTVRHSSHTNLAC